MATHEFIDGHLRMTRDEHGNRVEPDWLVFLFDFPGDTNPTKVVSNGVTGRVEEYADFTIVMHPAGAVTVHGKTPIGDAVIEQWKKEER